MRREAKQGDDEYTSTAERVKTFMAEKRKEGKILDYLMISDNEIRIIAKVKM